MAAAENIQHRLSIAGPGVPKGNENHLAKWGARLWGLAAVAL